MPHLLDCSLKCFLKTGLFLLCGFCLPSNDSALAQTVPTSDSSFTAKQPVPELPFTLDVLELQQGQVPTLKVPADGIVDLYLIRNNEAVPTPDQVTIYSGPFRSDVDLLRTIIVPVVQSQNTSSAKRNPGPADRSNVGVAAVVLDASYIVQPFQLLVPEILTDKVYTGLLVLAAQGYKQKSVRLMLSRATPSRPATLILAQQSIKQDITKSAIPLWVPSWLFAWIPFARHNSTPGNDSSISLGLRERDKNWPISCISLDLEDVGEAPGAGFDLERNVSATLNDKPLQDLCEKNVGRNSIPDIPAGTEGILKIGFKNLEAGKYVATLRISAKQAGANGQPLQLALRVRHHVAWAVLALIAGAIISFVGTALVSLYKERTDLLTKIAGLRSDWFAEWRENRPFLAVIKADAYLREAEELTRSIWLRAPDVITARINEAAAIIAILSTVREISDKITGMGLHDDVRDRVRGALDRIARQIGHDALSNEQKTQIENQLRNLQSRLQDSSGHMAYWNSLSGEADHLLDQIDPSLIFDQSRKQQFNSHLQALRKEVTDIRERLKNNPSNVALSEMSKVEQSVARVRMVWDRRKETEVEEFGQLLDATEAGIPFSKFRDLADSQIRVRLEHIHNNRKIWINMPAANGPDPLESYQLLTFTVETEDSFVSESPLFRRGLLYDWNILLQKRQGIIRTRLDTWRKKSQPPIFLGAKSNSPTVLRSAPWSGTLTVSVTLKQKDKNPIHVPSKSEPQLLTIPIKQSNQLTRLKVLLGMEAATSVITLMVSLISGLSLYYYTEEYVFGSFKTYLSLFTWAAGIDQGRNFVQTLQSYRKP